MIFVGMVLQCLALALFTVSTEFEWQMFARFLSGFSQVILSIFLPVWVDAYAPNESRTKWMTYIITAAPAGLFFGYTMTAAIVMQGVSWQWAFYLHIIMLIPMTQVIFAIKEQYLNVHSRLTPPSASPSSHSAPKARELTEYERWNLERLDGEQQLTADFSFEQKLKYVLRSTDYLLLLLGITCLFITVTAVQFWMTDYMVTVHGID